MASSKTSPKSEFHEETESSQEVYGLTWTTCQVCHEQLPIFRMYSQTRSNLVMARVIISNNSSYAGLAVWEGSLQVISSPSSTTPPHPGWMVPKTWYLVDQKTQETVPKPADWVTEECKGAIPFSNSSAISTYDPHNFSLHSSSATVGPELLGADVCPTSLENRAKFR